MCDYVCGCVHTHGTKSGAGPCWCGTKCHSLIRINSPIQALGLGSNVQQGKRVHGDSLLLFPLSVSLLFSLLHTHTPVF